MEVNLRKSKIIPLTEINAPNDNQAIIFDCVLEFKIQDYLVVIHQLVNGAHNIVGLSKVSKNRIIIQLQTKELVDEFLEQRGGFDLESNFVKFRRLKFPLTKIILSHVNSLIPNELIEE